MSNMYIKKNGLLYSPDEKTLIGVDDTSDEFNGIVPFGVRFVDDEVFSECPYESFSLPDSVKKIGKALFKDSKNLKIVKLPAFLTELPPELFSGCISLEKVVMPNELEGFPESLFQGCESMQEIPFRAGIKKLPKRVFAGCSSLKSLVVPNTVECIEENAVINCTGLESVVIPNSVRLIARGAFEGCTSIHNIRLNGESDVFYIGNDGCLYQKTGDEDLLVIKSYKVEPVDVDYFEENVDDKPIDFSDEDEEENEETVLCTEICDEIKNQLVGEAEIEKESVTDTEDVVDVGDELKDDEITEIGTSENETEIIELAKTEDKTENEIQEKSDDTIEGDNMSNENDVDSMLADIMGEEKERIAATEGVGVSKKESEVLSETISVMEDSNVANNGATVSNDELEKLFSKNEEQEIAAQSADDDSEIDSKAKILVDSVKLKKILNFEPASENEGDSDLYVIAEKTVVNEDGTEGFSSHLESCCTKMARIHDFKRIIMLYGLPVDNDEFMEFYRHFIGKKNIMLACEADRPSKLSDYCIKVCETSRILLDKNELVEQRKLAAVKTDNLIKLVVRDIYE